MIFNSLTFIFLCFIPCIICVLFIEKIGGRLRVRIQNVILVLFSLFFYAWSGTQYMKILVSLILLNYVLGFFIKKSRAVLALGILLNLVILFYYKYLNLVITTYNDILHRDFFLWEIIAPLGISFIIFQCISYIFDVYHEKGKVCRNFLDFALYISFFPKISQGPIVKYQDMVGQLKERRITFEKFIRGLERFIIGLSKKILIADILGQTSGSIFYNMGMGMDVGTAWIALLCYTFSLYMDFSGYSDMAIGMAAMFGFDFKENFNFPYLSTSVTEFWRRWHISLGAWFREYLYFPLGGSRKGNVYLNLFIVFLATGIWHGAAWVYLFWGAMHGVCVVVERYLMRKGWYEKIPAIFRWAATFFIVSIGWITFNVSKFDEFTEFLGYLFGRGTPVSFTWLFYLTPRLVALWAVVIFGTLIFSRKKVQIRLSKWNEESQIFNGVKYVMLLACVFLCFITSVSEGYQPFLYFQF